MNLVCLYIANIYYVMESNMIKNCLSGKLSTQLRLPSIPRTGKCALQAQVRETIPHQYSSIWTSNNMFYMTCRGGGGGGDGGGGDGGGGGGGSECSREVVLP